MKKKTTAREIMVSSSDGALALQAASDLGIEVTTAEVRGAGAEPFCRS